MDTRSGTGAAPDPYDVLGVDPSAPAGRITSAYRCLVHRLHPDTRTDEAAAEAFGRVLAADETLRDPAARATHDRRRNGEPPAPVRRGASTVATGGTGRSPARTPLLRAGPVRAERAG